MRKPKQELVKLHQGGSVNYWEAVCPTLVENIKRLTRRRRGELPEKHVCGVRVGGGVGETHGDGRGRRAGRDAPGYDGDGFLLHAQLALPGRVRRELGICKNKSEEGRDLWNLDSGCERFSHATSECLVIDAGAEGRKWPGAGTLVQKSQWRSHICGSAGVSKFLAWKYHWHMF